MPALGLSRVQADYLSTGPGGQPRDEDVVMVAFPTMLGSTRMGYYLVPVFLPRTGATIRLGTSTLIESPSFTITELKAIFTKLGLAAKIVGTIPAELNPKKTKTQPIRLPA